MLEALIVTICLKENKGCNEALRAYYATPTPITRTIRIYKGKVKKYYKKIPILQVVAPIVGVVLEQEATIKLYRGYSLTAGSNKGILIYEYGF